MKVRAIEMGFYKNSRVRPGTVFEMPEASESHMPRWVEPADQPARPFKARPPLNYDTKPEAARKAAEAKAQVELRSGTPGQQRSRP